MRYANMELRQLIDFCQVSLKELSVKMDRTPVTISRWFSTEMSEERKIEIKKAVKEIVEERTRKS